MSRGILAGIRVLDLSGMLAGPYCTMMLADHGAEVIKIEDPGGDTSRNNGPYREDDPEHAWAGYFVSLNRGKKSVRLDLESDEGREAFRRLAATADVIVENFRPGVMDRLDLSFESLIADNPRLVYAAIRGFGDPRSGTSPYADWPACDVVAQAMGGVMAITGPDAQTPIPVGSGIADIFSGLLMSFGILAALRQAEATGVGQFVDVAMYDAILSLCERAVYLHDMAGLTPGPEGSGHPFLAPFGLFPAADGFVALGIVDDAFWCTLAGAMGRPELGEDPRYATRAARSENSAAVNAMTRQWTAGLTKAELCERLGGQVPFGPLNNMADIFADPHVAARGMLAQVPHSDPGKAPWRVAANPLRFGGRAPETPATPPRLGEHTESCLQAVSSPAMSEADRRILRNAFGCFATGVTIVTTREKDSTPRGFTANSFTSVSLDPPLLLICIDKSAHSRDVFIEASHFAVNILSEEQKAVSGLFASQSPEKFKLATWQPGRADMPLLDGSLSTFVCAQHRLVDAGDHLILIGRVVDFRIGEGQPLGYYKGSYFSIGLEEDLVSAARASGAIRIGVILVRGREVLLHRMPDGEYRVPCAPAENNSLDHLQASLEERGLRPRMDYLYAVYQDSETGLHGIFYHGTVTGEAPEGMRYFNLQEIPLQEVRSAAERSMLARYADEFRHGSFGIYQGDESNGLVHKIARRQPSEH